jgi:Uma2 family endonuclease
MIQAVQQDRLVDFDEFINWYPEQSEHRYELHGGIVIIMPNMNINRASLEEMP